MYPQTLSNKMYESYLPQCIRNYKSLLQQSIRVTTPPRPQFASLVTMGVRCRLLKSIMGLRPRQGNLRLVFRLFHLMQGLKTSLRFP